MLFSTEVDGCSLAAVSGSGLTLKREWVTGLSSVTGIVGEFAWEASGMPLLSGQLIHDSRSMFKEPFETALTSMGIKASPIRYHAPAMNGIAKGFIGTLKRVCPDRFIVLGGRHLDCLVMEFVRRYIGRCLWPTTLQGQGGVRWAAAWAAQTLLPSGGVSDRVFRPHKSPCNHCPGLCGRQTASRYWHLFQ